MHKASAMTLTVIVASTLLVSCSGGPDPESSVELKRGVRLRVITLVDDIKSATLGAKSLPAFPISGDIAWFSSVPAKECQLVIAGRPDTKLNLEPNYCYTVFVTGESIENFRTPDSSKARTTPTLSVLNSTTVAAKVIEPVGIGTVEAATQSATMAVAIDGPIIVQSGSLSLKGSVKSAPDGQYTAVVYSANGQAQLKVLYDNPPMNVAGASNPG
ncbi:MAG: hypothetical protein IT203_07425 [Fimbriimonadaceae bacterium]|nr:hypothetical protein [Fimbriimonadaceae bacterium]